MANFNIASLDKEVNKLTSKNKVDKKVVRILARDKETSKIKYPTKAEINDANHIEIKVIVPSTRDGKKAISKSAFEKRIREVSEVLDYLFGGTSLWIGRGNWSGKKVQVNEVVAIITSFTTNEQYSKSDERLRKYLLEKKQNWGQEDIAFVFNNKMIFI